MKLLVTLAAAAALALPAALSAQVSVVSSTLEERQATPGERYAGTIRVRNTSGQPQQARVSAADYRFLADGRTFYERPGTAPRSNAAWVQFSPSQLTLAPGEEAAVAYTVAVPAGAEVRGSYWSVLMVETVQPAARAAQRGVGITPSIRYAVQLATHVGQAERRIALEGARLTGQAGARALEVDVLNTGEQADRLELRVDLFDAEGAPAGRLTRARGLVYPGTSIHQRFDFPSLPAGTYRALLVVDTGSDQVFGAEYTLRL
jgi:P pilus assembly chaperone PapD